MTSNQLSKKQSPGTKIISQDKFHCRFSHSSDCVSVIPLGEMPLANALLTAPPAPQDEPRYNLEVMLCRKSGLVQLKDIVPPHELFSNYVYFSSNSQTMLKSAADLVERLIPELTRDSLVVEIASNDGYLLKNYIENGIPVLGIDPAQNIAAAANEAGINTLCAFFDRDLATRLAENGDQADIIHANNVFAHVPDINGFVEGIKILLKPKGTAIIEVPYLLDLVEKLEFDTIYHEHVYYFSVTALVRIFAAHGLALVDIEKLPIHGGTLRLFVRHEDHVRNPSAKITEYIGLEEEKGLHDEKTYTRLMAHIEALKGDLSVTLQQLKSSGASIAAYGASAKGTTLLNYFGIGNDLIDFVVDRSPVKQGLYTPGTHLKIMPPEELLTRKPDYTLLLAWNFMDEILAQQTAYRAQGGKFIVPLPKVMVI